MCESGAFLEIHHLNVLYGATHALRGAPLKVEAGSIVTLVGSNGAGKSTTLRTISGLVRPKGGSITLLGEDITRAPVDGVVKRGVVMVPEGRKVFANLTVWENLRIGAYNRSDLREIAQDVDWVAMDFVSMTMTPHAPLMWAYNAATGQKNEIGPFTPMSRTVKNFATVMGVQDWSNSSYNIEGRIRKEMGLPAYDKWDDYRVGRMIVKHRG